MITLAAEGIRLIFDPDLGMITQFHVSDGAREIAPLHRAPWVDAGETMPEDSEPHHARLGGDFFCAPFGGREGASGLHGWPANSRWDVAESGTALIAELERKVFGATLRKELRLRDGHPFVYQRHVFTGGAGRLPVANHANVSLRDGGIIRTSKKSIWRTPATPQESDPARGRSGLAYPAESAAFDAFPGVDGPVDLGRYPWFPRHEDFVAGIEAPGHALGWTAVTRPAQGDLFLSLRRAAELPMTMLWHSNGGRDYPPWSGRHFGCLGVEEGIAGSVLGETDGLLALDPEGEVAVTHVIGAIPWPGGAAVQALEVAEDRLRIVGDDGSQVEVPVDVELLMGSG